jgi:chloride channel protein, CIC family
MNRLKNVATVFSRAFGVVDVSYLRKWLVIAILIGIIAGIGSILFYLAIDWASRLLLGQGAGYIPPSPGGEGLTVFTPITRRWMIPVISALGGLISGFIVFRWAPEAEGHGTDAAINCFHNKDGFIRRRITLVKIIASAITIGSGGSAGREGPVALIGAGFGSTIAGIFKLNAHDRRIALAIGIGAGIGAIFKAPLGGALISAEIPYRRDFEFEALFPSFIASIVGYSIFASWHGWVPIFTISTGFAFSKPQELLGYAILGIVCGLFGILYGRTFYQIRDFFRSLKIPNYIKPAIGGLIVGIIGIFLPQILGMGY